MFVEGTRGLRMTALQIPQHVAINQTVKMECNFNLDQELLYSVKWYKDGHEFYRFVPKDSPAVQVFPVPGVSVDVSNPIFNFKLSTFFHRSWIVLERFLYTN